jgi:lysophospholipase L1-like esterase
MMHGRALILGAAILACAAAYSEETNMDAVMQRSLVSLGNTARLDHVLAKARRGETVTVSVIGGSITAGAMASKPELNYGGVLAAWWQKTFPQAQIHLVNAGIGATGSDYGTLRAQRDLLSKNPDFVVVEYGVNDGNTEQAAETYEGLLRQILKRPNHPAVVMMFMMNNIGANAQEWQSAVGRHYDLPMISYRDALWPEIEAGRLTWKDISPDEVHPNDRGHAYVAQFVERVLQAELDKLPADENLPKIKPVQEPLLTDMFEKVDLFEADALKPVKNDGWTYDKANNCWKADKPGSVVEFVVTGRAIFAMTFTVKGPMGMANIQVDDLPPLKVNGWFSATWGGYRPTWLLPKVWKLGKHKVRVELLDEKDPGSTGHEFRIMGIGVAGL